MVMGGVGTLDTFSTKPPTMLLLQLLLHLLLLLAHCMPPLLPQPSPAVITTTLLALTATTAYSTAFLRPLTTMTSSSTTATSKTFLPYLTEWKAKGGRLILASKSPRRLEILQLMGFSPSDGSLVVQPSQFEEDLDKAGRCYTATDAATATAAPLNTSVRPTALLWP